MHDDWSQLPSFEWVFEERRNILQSQELPMDNSKSVLNTGVVMCDRKHASIWKPPLHPFFPTHMLRGTAKIEELLPDRWKAAHPEAVREYREQERRDKADTAIVQAARRRVRAELRKGK
jgi:hypothetical protein